MTPEERAEMEAAEKADVEAAKGEPTAASVQNATANASVPSASTPGSAGSNDVGGSVPFTATGTTSATDANPASASAAEDSLRSLSLHGGEQRPAASPSASSSSDQLAKQKEKEKAKGKAKLSPEQKAKLDELEKKQDEEKEKRWAHHLVLRNFSATKRTDYHRITDLQAKLVARIRPFVDAKNPGDQNDHETKVFEARIRTEAEDLKLESFGIEVCPQTTTW